MLKETIASRTVAARQRIVPGVAFRKRTAIMYDGYICQKKKSPTKISFTSFNCTMDIPDDPGMFIDTPFTES